ncbi:tetratricopeptide repeat protein [Aridibaculum aurantiacum]|uniref:tetratricopeptide repeat protein n=1 Tax=Aridibaculum aurantiacum TaxID=2810307 RepID=UPI001A97B983|nr:tetratricopeptide repeat protein [Aridibaculum aurantiacum]
MRLFSLLLVCCIFYSTTSLATADSSTYFLQKALHYQQTGKTREANLSIQQALAFTTNDVAIRLQYGSMLLEQKRYSAAKEQFKLVLQKDETNTVALMKICVASAALNHWSDVMEYGSKVQETNDASVYYLLGKAYYYEEEYDLAQQILNKLVKKNPVHHEGLAMLARVYVELSDYRKAQNFYSQALIHQPSDANLLYEYGLVLFVLNNPKEAVTYMEVAAEKGYKADLDYLENLGMAYLNFDIDKGIEVLSNVLKRKPNNPDIQLQIAHAFYKSKKYDHAAERYYNMYLHDPNNIRALYMMGMAYQKKGEKAKGINICEKALQLDHSLAEHKILGYAK